ncbi:MAG: RagB/SusD family nutrient uptake outer membrane protein [Muribaculaceae bacterium]|nr:RagB/SusD family nutrient uptake outer membrane protein [Muribaculaceae bacterium]
MKKTLLYGCALAAAMMATSCDDFLTEDVRGTENLDTYFQTEEEVNSFVGGCYFEITKMDWWQVVNAWLMSDMTTDDMWDGNTTQDDGYQDVTHFMPSAPTNGILQNFWGARYQGINTCNTAIARIPGAKMDETLREQRLAEARFLRAFFYFDLARNFGGVPLIKEPLSNAEGIGRASLDEVYDFLEAEFDAVSKILPERSEYSAADMGRATRGAALGFLGKVQLYRGKYDAAKATLSQLTRKSTEYELLPDFGQVWSVKYNNSKESLFEVQQTYGGDQYQLGGALTVMTGCRNGVGDGWSWGQPTSDLENAYIAAGDTERLRWTIIKTGCTEIAGENQFEKFIENNSTVFEKGINDAKFTNYKDVFGWTNAVYNSSYVIDPAQHKSARIIRKYFLPLEDRPEVYNICKIPLNHRILRYADVLLMYAEACNETNDDNEARWALNEVRKRVHLPDVTASGDELRQAIRLERRLELAFEQNRLYDIRRWKENGKSVMANLFGPSGSFVKYNLGPDADMYENWNQGEPSSKGTRFVEPRDLLWPVPSYEVQHSNGAIIQNEGW